MRILLFDNAGLIYRRGRFCCVEGTGCFAAELVALGASVTMYGQKIHIESNVSVFDIEESGVRVAGLWQRKNKFLNYILLYFHAFVYILKSDFVYFFYPNAFRFLAFLCILLRKKYGLYIRGEQGIEDRISFAIYTRSYVILTVSPLFSKIVNSIVGYELAETIRPMISYDENDIILDREYHDKSPLNLLFLSRIQKEKGLIELFDALKELKDFGETSFFLTIVGDGDYLTQAKEDCHVRGLDDSVRFLGGIYDKSQKASIFEHADIYILPTYNEGFPRTLYEAMIFGTPIITTFVGGIPALMKNGENCLRIEPKSAKSIEDALRYAACHYEIMGKIAKKASETVANVISSKRPSHARQLYSKIHSNI